MLDERAKYPSKNLIATNFVSPKCLCFARCAPRRPREGKREERREKRRDRECKERKRERERIESGGA